MRDRQIITLHAAELRDTERDERNEIFLTRCDLRDSCEICEKTTTKLATLKQKRNRARLKNATQIFFSFKLHFIHPE